MNQEFGRLLIMVDMSPKGLGKRIRARREKLGISQTKLAEALDIPQQTVAGWETGAARRPRLLMEAATVLCTTQQWLLREEGPEEIAPVVPKDQIASAVESLDPRLHALALEYLRNLQKSQKAKDEIA